MKLIAVKDISDQLRAGDAFDAPDAILVAMGLARLADVVDEPSRPEYDSVTSRTPRRRVRREIEAD